MAADQGRPGLRMNYPTRCRILDVTGETLPGTTIGLATPPVSKPHVGKEGLAEKIGEGFDYSVRITLDDGTILWGWECWWEPIP